MQFDVPDHHKNSVLQKTLYFSPVKHLTALLLFLFFISALQIRADVIDDSIAVILHSNEADTIIAKKLIAIFHEYKIKAPDLALKAAESAFQFAKEKNLEYYKGRALSFIGTANYSMDRYTAALESYLQALQMFEKLGKKREQGVILNNMGNIFLDQELPDQALPYYQRALAIDRELNLDHDIAMDLMNISSAYSVTPKLDSAFILCSQAMKKAEELNDTSIYVQCLGNLGIIEFQQKKYDDALKDITQAEKLFKQYDIETNIGVLYLSLGDLYIERKEIQKATHYYSNALENAKELESIDDERLAYLGLSKSAELAGNTKQAYDYFRKYSLLNDSIFNIKSARKQTQLLLNYELDKKEVLQKASEEKTEAVHAAQLGKQRSQKNFFIAGFIVVFFLLFIMLRQYRLKNRSNKKLSETLENLERTQTQLIHQEKMASLGMLTAGIAHEIQNPLNFVTNFSESSKELIHEINLSSDEKEKQELMADLTMNIEKISSHGKRADNIIKSMLRHSHGDKEEKRPTNINKLCDEFLMLAYHSLRASHPDFNCTIEKNFQPDMPKVNVMAQEVTRVMLNLFTNAFHALKERQEKEKDFSPVIAVTTKIENQFAKITVRDNGTGIPEHIRNKIFQPFFTTKKSGEGTGLGLSISYDIIKAHGGELKVSSEIGRYTEFLIELPL